MAKKRKFTAEFKAQAVELARRSDSLSDVARELGLPLTTLHQWVKKSTTVKPLTAQEMEIQRLKRELDLVSEERDFLKKAAAFFARNPSSGSK